MLSNKMTKFTITLESSTTQEDMWNVRILQRKFIRLYSLFPYHVVKKYCSQYLEPKTLFPSASLYHFQSVTATFVYEILILSLNPSILGTTKEETDSGKWTDEIHGQPIIIDSIGKWHFVANLIIQRFLQKIILQIQPLILKYTEVFHI